MTETNLPASLDDNSNSISDETINKCLKVLNLERDHLSAQAIKTAWKKQLVAQRDTIGRADDHDLVASINSAKDTLLDWLEKKS